MKFNTGIFVVVLLILWDSALSNNTQRIGKTRIIGGQIAKKNEFPFLVRIQWKWNGGLLCGGTIIRTDTILTASHCMFGDQIRPSDLEIVAGDHDITKNEGTEQIKNIKRVVLHENYNPKTLENDICLLTLSSNFDLTEAVKTIPLPLQGYTLPGTAITAGWGLEKENTNDVVNILRKVSVPILSNDVCKEQYFPVSITSQMLCAGLTGKDSCQGDSGGPLLCKDGNSTQQLACGIVSFGKGCGQENFPGIYTRNSEYLNWISAVHSESAAKKAIISPTNRGNEGLQIFPNLIWFLFFVLSLVT